MLIRENVGVIYEMEGTVSTHRLTGGIVPIYPVDIFIKARNCKYLDPGGYGAGIIYRTYANYPSQKSEGNKVNDLTKI